jgi:drug/metabolite transporter (DMT)-like permease
MILAPIFAALALASGTLTEKLVLMKRKVTVRFYETGQFLAISLVMLPFIFFLWRVDSQALSFTNILVFIGIIILSILANYFTFNSMKQAKLSRIEPAKMTEPLFVILLTIILSFVFQSGIYERNTQVVIPALVAGAALIGSHIKKHHLNFSKPFLYSLLGSFLFASELVLSKIILEYYNGFTFYFLRCLFVFIVAFIIFRPKIFRGHSPKVIIHIFIIAIIWVIYRVIIYYGYLNAGIIQTTLIVMLGPIFIYLFAWKFLKEKPTWRNLIASLIILCCVLYVAII